MLLDHAGQAEGVGAGVQGLGGGVVLTVTVRVTDPSSCLVRSTSFVAVAPFGPVAVVCRVAPSVVLAEVEPTFTLLPLGPVTWPEVVRPVADFWLVKVLPVVLPLARVVVPVVMTVPLVLLTVAFAARVLTLPVGLV